MADEELAIAEMPGQETATEQPADVTVADEPERIPDPLEAIEEQQEGEPEAVEEVEIDWDDGKKYRIPKAIESGILKNKDYTTKTQETAAIRKALDAEKAAIEERRKATDAELDDRAALRSIKSQIEAYEKLTQADWDAHEAQDPLGTQQHWRNFQLLQRQASEAQARLDATTKQRTDEAQQEFAKRVQDTLAHVSKLPGAGPDTIKQLVEFANEFGVPEEAIKSNWSPLFAELLFNARIGTLTRQKQAAAPKPIPTPIQPLETVGGKSTPATRGDLASMDMDAYVAARKKGVGGKPLR